MKPIAITIAAGALAYAAWIYYRQSQQGAAAGESDANSIGDFANWSATADSMWSTANESILEGYSMVKGAIGLWDAPPQYRPLIVAAETRYGIPSRMLERLLYQESRYREDIINGTKTSPAGALGIAQFMPATAAGFGINPLDPSQAIDAAGKYLAQLYKQFGSWAQALAAYNWGPGNVRKKGLAAAPAETRNYYSQIMASLGMATLVA